LGRTQATRRKTRRKLSTKEKPQTEVERISGCAFIGPKVVQKRSEARAPTQSENHEGRCFRSGGGRVCFMEEKKLKRKGQMCVCVCAIGDGKNNKKQQRACSRLLNNKQVCGNIKMPWKGIFHFDCFSDKKGGTVRGRCDDGDLTPTIDCVPTCRPCSPGDYGTRLGYRG